MKKSILITGGARSGKSALAERVALKPAGRAIYIATARLHAGDDEMAERVAKHKARRGAAWQDVHAPTDLAGALRDTDGSVPRLVDCLTLWLTNLILDNSDWQSETDRLVETLARQPRRSSLSLTKWGRGSCRKTSWPGFSAMPRGT